MIELTVKTKKYDGFIFVRDLHLHVATSDFVVIRGETGSGKSTILNILNLLDQDYEGEYQINGTSLNSMSSSKLADFRKNHFGIIFQDYNVIPQMTVYENIMFALDIVNFNGDRDARAREVIELVGLLGHEEKLFNQLSGGQQQRIGIARAIAPNPDYIFADEPTGNLDPETTKEILDIFTRLNKQGKTIILITHSEDVVKYGNRVVTIDKGSVINDEIINPTPVIQQYFNDKKRIELINLFKIGAHNLRRHFKKYFVTNLILVAALIVFVLSLYGIQEFTDEDNYNYEQNMYRVELLYNKNDEFIDYDTIHDKYLEVGTFFKNSHVLTEFLANAKVLQVNNFNLTTLEEEQFKNTQNILSFYDYEQSSDDYYLIAGEDPVEVNDIVISEQFIKNFLDSSYDIKKGNPSSYVGQSVEITLLEPQSSFVNYTDDETAKVKFNITGVDNSREQNTDLDVNVYTNYQTLNALPAQVEFVPNLGLFVDPELYTVDDIVDVMNNNGYYENQAISQESGVINSFTIRTPPRTTGDYVGIFILILVIGIILITIIISLTLSNLLSTREREFGIYFALGLDQFSIFKMIASEFLINATIISSITTIFVMLFIEFLYLTEVVIPPTVLVSLSDYVLLFVFGITISILSLVIVLTKVLRTDPIKIIRGMQWLS